MGIREIKNKGVDMDIVIIIVNKQKMNVIVSLKECGIPFSIESMSLEKP